nr:hypothetical protein [Actinokineospora baliensis]
MRHAHAYRLLRGGADLQTVRERLGHATSARPSAASRPFPNPPTQHSTPLHTSATPPKPPNTTCGRQSRLRRQGAANSNGVTSVRFDGDESPARPTLTLDQVRSRTNRRTLRLRGPGHPGGQTTSTGG